MGLKQANLSMDLEQNDGATVVENPPMPGLTASAIGLFCSAVYGGNRCLLLIGRVLKVWSGGLATAERIRQRGDSSFNSFSLSLFLF